MLPPHPLTYSAVRLMAGCCVLLSVHRSSGQPASSAPATSPDAAVAAPPERPPAPAAVLDTWGTSSPPAVPPEPKSVTDPVAPAIPASAVPAETTPTSEADEPSHVRYLLEGIEVRGNARTRSSVVLRYLPFRSGRELDVDDPEFTLARYRLLGTGFFREVEFSLRKGSKRGSVVLVVDVVERSTEVVNGFWMGLSKDADTNGVQTPLTAYGGFDVAETNFGGYGITLGGAVGMARNQLAVRARFLDPAFLGTPWMVTGTLLYNRATDFFGTREVVWEPPSDTIPTKTDYALVPYKRFGGSVGIGRDLSVSSQLWFNYRLETISANRPPFAQQNRGGKTEPIEFDIIQGRSVLNTIGATFQYDTRDHPFLPTRGVFFSTRGELSLLPLGSDYNYQLFEFSSSYFWHKKDSPHVFRLQLFAGGISGSAPFFEQYYVGDFNDFLPARMLSLNVDRRPSPDVFRLGTAIREVRYGQYAAQIAGEYRLPVYRGHRSVFGIDFFLRAGVFLVADRRSLLDPAPEYHGFQRIPIDLTVNAGFRMDTSAGGVVFSLANVLGLLPAAGGSK